MNEKRSKEINQEISTEEQIASARWKILQDMESWLEGPVVILGQVWLVVLVIELIWDANEFLEAIAYTIWGIFVLDFLLRLAIAPQKQVYFRKNLFKAISLAIPAFRLFHVFRFASQVHVMNATLDPRVGKAGRSLDRVREIIERLIEQQRSKQEP